MSRGECARCHKPVPTRFSVIIDAFVCHECGRALAAGEPMVIPLPTSWPAEPEIGTGTVRVVAPRNTTRHVVPQTPKPAFARQAEADDDEGGWVSTSGGR